MRSILQKRSLRFVFAANVISMLGSGMNSAAVAWTILQRTHSEMALGTFAALQTIPAMLMLPFTGVIIDREDRRRLVMWLDASRAIVIFAVMVLICLPLAFAVAALAGVLLGYGFWVKSRPHTTDGTGATHQSPSPAAAKPPSATTLATRP